MSKTIWIINQTASTPETGMGGRHYYLARELGLLGYNVYVIAASYTHLLRSPPKVTKSITIEANDGFHMVWLEMPHYAHARSTKRVWNWFLFTWKLLRVHKIIKDRPDVILYSSPPLVGYLGAERLARRFAATLVFEVRDIWPLTLCEIGGYSENHPFIRFLQWIENRAYRNSDIVLSNLRDAYRHMVRHGLDKEKFHWIPNGISLTEVTRPDAVPSEIEKQLDGDAFKIGYVGTLGVANCLDNLLRAAAILKSKDKGEVQFVLVGKGKEEQRLRKIVRDEGLDNVIFIGPIPKSQVQSMLQKFDVTFIGLPKEELFRFGVSPNKLYDYMYAARPILYAIDSGEYRPIAAAHAGLEVPAEDPEALADAISHLQCTPAVTRIAMGKNARRVVATEYNYSVLAKDLADIVFARRGSV